MQVRAALPIDTHTIQRFVAEVVHAHPEGRSPEQITRYLNSVYSENSLLRMMMSSGSAVFIALDEGQLCGMLSFGAPLLDECVDRKEIHRLHLHLHADPLPIAAGLLNAARAELRRQPEVRRVSVYVRESDPDRRDQFTLLGFAHEASEDKEGTWYLVLNL